MTSIYSNFQCSLNLSFRFQPFKHKLVVNVTLSSDEIFFHTHLIKKYLGSEDRYHE